MRAARPAPFYLDADGRKLFALHYAPAGTVSGAVIHVPAFAEEMNKSRHMVALQARSLANAGWHVLVLDLYGTGDSEGDFGDARWSIWQQDVDAARRWLRAESGLDPWLWGLRLGALLATVCAGSRPPPGLLVWQPVLSGRQHLQQFLRLLAGAEWLGGKAQERAAAKPMDQLMSGESVEIAGYTLHPQLAMPLADASVSLSSGAALVRWLEVTTRDEGGLSPAAERLVASARSAVDIEAKVVSGPSFWQSLEIEEAPSLLHATTLAMTAASGRP